MKNPFIILFLFCVTLSAQKIDYNHQDGYIAEGYDVVSYFSNKVEKGNSKYVYEYNGAKYRFSSQANLDTFKGNPKKYAPLYGGWCGYALTRGKKVKVDPESYTLTKNGELILFYDSFTNDARKKWLSAGEAKLKPKADANWEKVKTKK